MTSEPESCEELHDTAKDLLESSRELIAKIDALIEHMAGQKNATREKPSDD